MTTDFITAIINAGLTPPSTLVGDGKLHRFAGNGDARKRNSWYIYHDDEFPAGVFGDWKTGLKVTWSAKSTRGMDPEAQRRRKAFLAESARIAEQETARIRKECRDWSVRAFGESSPAPADHPYLARKQIPASGARLYRDSLMIPVMDACGTIHGVQFIAPDGSKKFKTGTPMGGNFFYLGRPNGKIIICEGFATGVSLHLATGWAVIVAFAAGNLLPVAQAIRKRRPDSVLVLAADHDPVGLEKAAEAVRAVAGVLAYPDTPGEDFNDLHCREGLDAVRVRIERAQDPAETVEEPPPPPEPEPDVSELPPPEPPPGKVTPQEQSLNAVLSLNETHFVSTEGGKTYVYAEHWDERMGRNMLVRSSFKDFENFHLNHLVFSHFNKDGSENYKSLGKVWLEHPARRQFDGVILEPGVNKAGFYNLWRGFSVESRQGSWGRMQDHLYENICRADDKLFTYVMGWLATAVQKPGVQAETALVLRGKRGTGKGMLGKYMCRLFGGNSAHISHTKYLTGNFNSHLRDVVFMFADEAFWAGDKAGESVLKALITEPTLTIEGKGRDIVFCRNMLHVLMASNNEWVVPAGLEERRFCVLDVSDAKMQDKRYFGALSEQMDNQGGLQAMLYDLEQYDLSEFEIRDVPNTDGLFEQKLQSLDPFLQWWFVRLSEGELIPGEGWEKVPTRKLYQSYIESMAERAINHRAGETVFGINIKRIVPFRPGFKRLEVTPERYDRRENVYHFPPLEECREHFEEQIKTKIEWS